MIPVHQPDGTATDSAAVALFPTSAYYQRLHPWQLIRHLPHGLPGKGQHLTVGRFRSRSLAEAHLKALRRLDPSASYLILFDPGVIAPDQQAD